MHDFIHNAGHELKTPIAIIDSNLQLIKQTKKFDKELVKE
jgi:signal transduction histidine kinase